MRRCLEITLSMEPTNSWRSFNEACYVVMILLPCSSVETQGENYSLVSTPEIAVYSQQMVDLSYRHRDFVSDVFPSLLLTRKLRGRFAVH